MNIVFKILLVIGILFLKQEALFSNQNKELKIKQIEYLLKAAQKTKTTPHSTTKYKIALIGSNRDTKKFLTSINDEFSSKRIRSRKIIFTSYKKLSEVGNEDLIIFTSGDKLRSKGIGTKLSSINYIVLKASTPYGLSFFNADNQSLMENILDLEVENSEKEKLLQNASIVIHEQEDSINNKNLIIDKSAVKIESQSSEIEIQSSEIIEKSGIIEFQKIIIIVGVLTFIIISLLLVLLYISNKKRKLNLIELKIKNKDITDSLNYAKNIQDAILPDAKLFSSSFKDHFIFFKPKDIVSGDFYWSEKYEGKMYFAVADCTGHGVPGAFLSLVCSRILSKVIKEHHIASPSKILDTASLELEVFFSKNDKKINDGMDISLICVDELKNEIIFSGAHSTLLYIKEGELKSIVGDKQPIGAFDFKKSFTQTTISIDKIDTLYLFSDGYADQFGGPKNKKFSKKRFKELLLDIQNLPLKQQGEKIETELNNWRSDYEQIDDITVVGFKF